jgi:hypothetical protein
METDLFGNIIISDTDNVYLNKNTKIKDLSNDIKTEYCIEIIFDNEKQQEQMYNELTKKGYICRVLTL